MIENRLALCGIIICLQQVLAKQALVQRRSYLGHKNAIVAILKWLTSACKIRMHRMPQFVRQGIHTIPLVLVVQQNKWPSCVPATTIRSTTLARCLKDIDPPLLKCLFENFGIVLAQWSQSSYHGITCLLVAYLIGCFLNNRHIQIIHVQLIELEQAFTQPHVAIEQVNMLTDRLYQVVIHIDGNVITCQRPFATRAITTLSRVKDITFDLRR